MDELEDLTIEINIKSIDYLVNVNTINADKFVLEIQNIETAEVWRGAFESSYIEDLTRKTGNFKAFHIFINMLQAALRQESSTVILDILTYSDLELLREKNSANCNSSRSHQQNASCKNTNNKRYLILTYNVEFDRINYPLQLNYQGIPNPIELSKTINNLRRQLKLYENKNGAEFRMNEISRLDQENKTLTKEKEVLALEILKLRSEEKHRNRRVDSLPNVSALKESGNAQEIKILKQMMKSIEENSIKEKNFFQRAIIKKDEEINLLKYQINQVKSSEKSLMSQLKYSEDKFRNKNVSRNSSRNTSIDHSFRKNSSSMNRRTDSTESLTKKRPESPYFNHDYMKQKPNPTAHRINANQPRTNANSNRESRGRSGSLDRLSGKNQNSRGVSPMANSRGISPASSTNSINSINSYASGYSNGSKKRFNPTDYVKAKRERSRDIELKKKQEIRYKICGNHDTKNTRTRSRSADSHKSYTYSSNNLAKNKDTSYLSSFSEIDYIKECQPARNSRKTKVHAPTSNIFNREQEMMDIDEKLKSLQMLIKNSI